MELLVTLCGYVATYRNWVEDSIYSTKLWLANIEAQGVSHFQEWKEHVRSTVVHVKAVEISVKTLQHDSIELTNLSNKHDEELGMIFNRFATFHSSLQKSTHTVTERIDMIEASNLGVTGTSTSLPEQLILESKVE